MSVSYGENIQTTWLISNARQNVPKIGPDVRI